jgi:hypothetical protein
VAIGNGFLGELQAAMAMVKTTTAVSCAKRVVDELMGFLPYCEVEAFTSCLS